MATIAEIQNFLNIEIPYGKRLHDGKKRSNKNIYYFFKGLYYIVKLTQNNWTIAEDCVKTRKLLKRYVWSSHLGYATTNVNGSSKSWHQLYLNYENGLVADHINNNRYDNRSENLRIVTPQHNARNLSKSSNNTSGKQGVCKDTIRGFDYWKVQIKNNERKCITKRFSIAKFGNEEAFRQAVEYRKALEIEYGYIGD